MSDQSNVTPLRKISPKSLMDLAMEHIDAETQEQRAEMMGAVAKKLQRMGLLEAGQRADAWVITPAGWQAITVLMSFASLDRTKFEEAGLAPSTEAEWESVHEWLKIRRHFDAVATEALYGAHERTTDGRS